MSALLALMCAGLWGASDFTGGQVTKRFAAIRVLAVSQLIALLAGVVIALVSGQTHLTMKIVIGGVGGGIAGYIGMVCLYTGLATGRMGVVSPISSLGAAIPVLYALITGTHISHGKILGCALALIGAFLTSGPEFSQKFDLQPLLLAFGAALSFGISILFMAHGSQDSAFLTMVMMRVATAPFNIGLIVRSKSFGGFSRRDIPLLIFIGLADFAANITLGYATHIGSMPLAVVLGNLYPVCTAILAYAVLLERLHRAQYIGAISAVAGVALITAL
jgi:drug/metabolite transporter (DMT)-like permease